MACCLHCRLVFRHEDLLYHVIRRHPGPARALLAYIRGH